jgi:hypothetical protein
MQATNKELYKKVSETYKHDPNLVKSIGNCIFFELSSFFKNPSSLICKLKNVGTWYMRKKSLHEYIHRWDSYYTQDPSPIYEDAKLMQAYINNKNQFNILTKRVIDYDEYVKKKKRIQEIRHKTQPLIKPKPDEEC